MKIFLFVLFLFFISFILAWRSFQKEFFPSPYLKKLKVRKKRKIAGVILFLKKKIVHYSSDSSS